MERRSKSQIVSLDDLQCGGVACDGKLTGECLLAHTLRYQAQHGSDLGPDIWPKNAWKQFKSEIEGVYKEGDCTFPDQLREALEQVEPQLK